MNRPITRFLALGASGAFLVLSLSVRADTDLSINKTVDNSQPTLGNPVEFTISVSNLGPHEASSIEVTDRLPPDLTIPPGTAPFTSQGAYSPESGIWQVGTLSVNETAVLTIPMLPQAATQATCSVNTAQITLSTEVDSDLMNDWAIAGVYLGGAMDCARLTLAATIEQNGSTVTLSVEIGNEGPDLASGIGYRISGIEDHDDFDYAYGDLPAQHILKGGVQWDYDCGIESFTEDFKVTVYTDSTTARGSLLELNGRVDIPYTGACSIPDAFNRAYGGSGGGCFIATAAYGSYFEEHVGTLRQFRDDHLLTNRVGRRFVYLYYRYSPPIAAVIAEHEWLQAITRAFLTPIVFAVSYPLLAVRNAMILVLAFIGFNVWRKRTTVENPHEQMYAWLRLL